MTTRMTREQVHEASKVVRCGKLHMKVLEHVECVNETYRKDGWSFSTRLPCNDPDVVVVEDGA